MSYFSFFYNVFFVYVHPFPHSSRGYWLSSKHVSVALIKYLTNPSLDLLKEKIQLSFGYEFLHNATAILCMYFFLGIARPQSQFSHTCVPGSVHIFPPAEKADPSWEYIIRSQTHECGNWDWDPDIPFLGIFVSNFRHFVFAVQVNYFDLGMVLSHENLLGIIPLTCCISRTRICK